ncbi:uncharacterized protein BX663DRAFT_545212 [Cokeromyces recurvatus]|uniref:uncharacterized protein n=1 Tax=Cokeromyces recurvatus TaxID=90255 RepID=UPI00221E39A8|nr:uncharacterized protein BX663DRAFT_545212 [Cokeromyces recurvatus]KAI7899964.1 hypothetical protein BX663DRAFT_545212 [Cokeromyces recurvatus]
MTEILSEITKVEITNEEEDNKERVKTRHTAIKRTLSDDELHNESSSFKRSRSNKQPRWYNQAYMLFLALRQHPERTLPRGELIKAALALDRKISAELQLPRVFRSKTPGNSASACLTINNDRYFVAFKPEGSRSTYFKLAYEPGDEKKAIQEYQKWCKKLAEHDWPYCFGIPKIKKTTQSNTDDLEDSQYPTPISDVDDKPCTQESFNDKMEKTDMIKKEVPIVQNEALSKTNKTCERITSSDISLLSDKDNITMSVNIIENGKKDIIVKKHNIVTATKQPFIDSTKSINTLSVEVNLELQKMTQTNDNNNNNNIPATTTNAKKISNKVQEMPVYTLDELDLSDIPKSWRDIVYVAPSKIPGAGSGLFAKRKLPYNTPIGFYFGVPMTEDEFDSLKDRVGRASEYSIMYRRTVLDATDEHGEPITDEESERFCPFHFMNETDQEHATIAFVEGIIVNQVICWTKKDIEAGEELLVWYGADVERHWKQGEEKKKQQKKKENNEEVKVNKNKQ